VINVTFTSSNNWESVKPVTENGVMKNGFLYVKITCKLKDTFFDNGNNVDVQNTAKVTYGDTKIYESNTQTEHISNKDATSDNSSKDKETPTLSKSCYIRSSESGLGRFNYVVEINPDGKTLNNGGYLTLEDTLNYWAQVSKDNTYYDLSMDLLTASVKLYKVDDTFSIDETTGVVKGTSVDNELWEYDYDTRVNQFDPRDVFNTIKAKVPDGTHLYLVYTYEMNTTLTDENFNLTNIKNTVTLNGENSASVNEGGSWKISSSKASGTGDKSHIFRKVEAGKINKTLAGAVFALWEYKDGNWEDTGITYISSSDPLKGYGTFSVSQSGGLGISDETFQYKYNTAYYLVETQAPDGYLLPENQTKYLFYFSSKDTENNPYSMPPGFLEGTAENKPIDIMTDTGTTNITNKPVLTIKKVWKSSDGLVIDQKDESLVVEVTVYKKHGDKTDTYATYELDYSNQWTLKLTDLPAYDENDNLCTYTVVENSVKSGDEDVTAKYESKITNDGVVPGNQITITNQQLAVQYTLPNTGGSGRNLWYMFGGLLALGAGYLLIYKKHKII
jgi:LPXTG-motif cell wall-anchored protein